MPRAPPRVPMNRPLSRRSAGRGAMATGGPPATTTPGSRRSRANVGMRQPEPDRLRQRGCDLVRARAFRGGGAREPTTEEGDRHTGVARQCTPDEGHGSSISPSTSVATPVPRLVVTPSASGDRPSRNPAAIAARTGARKRAERNGGGGGLVRRTALTDAEGPQRDGGKGHQRQRDEQRGEATAGGHGTTLPAVRAVVVPPWRSVSSVAMTFRRLFIPALVGVMLIGRTRRPFVDPGPRGDRQRRHREARMLDASRAARSDVARVAAPTAGHSSASSRRSRNFVGSGSAARGAVGLHPAGADALVRPRHHRGPRRGRPARHGGRHRARPRQRS